MARKMMKKADIQLRIEKRIESLQSENPSNLTELERWYIEGQLVAYCEVLGVNHVDVVWKLGLHGYIEK